MKRLLLLPALLATGLALQAEPTEPTPRQAVREKLPNYSPEEHDRAVAEQAAREAVRAAAKAAAEADPDLVVLPDMTVMEKAQQKMTEESLYQKGAYDKELVKRELSSFDRNFLNRYNILGMSKEARAREAYLARRNAEMQERLGQLNRMVALQDKTEAREFREVLREAALDNAHTTKESARATSARGGAGGQLSQ